MLELAVARDRCGNSRSWSLLPMAVFGVGLSSESLESLLFNEATQEATQQIPNLGIDLGRTR